MKVIRSETTKINSESDIVLARKSGREIAEEIGFRPVDCTKIVTAISELARNICLYAKSGTSTINNVSIEPCQKLVQAL